MALPDAGVLAIIKQKLGGGGSFKLIKLRSGVKDVRYRLHNKKGMIELVNRINGKVRHSSRIKQLQSVCSITLVKELDIQQPLLKTMVDLLVSFTLRVLLLTL